MTEIQPVTPEFPPPAESTSASRRVADPHLSVAAVARALRISPATVRRYIRDYEDHVDVVRNGRGFMIAVSSVPALAQIRDLRARKFGREEIRSVLAAVPGQAIVVERTESIEAAARSAVKDAVDEALGNLRAELVKVKRATLDSDVVVRQTLANILFLIEKFGKELQFHVSEERIANNERDRRLARSERELKLLLAPPNDNPGLLSAVAGYCRRLLAGLFKRRSMDRP